MSLPAPRKGRMPLAVWIIVGVMILHAIVFWVVSDKRFLPKTRYLPPPTPAVNFGAAGGSSVDPQTGETTAEQEFTVSTRLVTPPPKLRPSPSAVP